MYWEDVLGFNGYGPTAPQVMSPGIVPVAVSGAQQPSAIVAPAGTSFGASANFAVAGWLAAIIIGLAAYRYLWEKAG